MVSMAGCADPAPPKVQTAEPLAKPAVDAAAPAPVREPDASVAVPTPAPPALTGLALQLSTAWAQVAAGERPVPTKLTADPPIWARISAAGLELEVALASGRVDRAAVAAALVTRLGRWHGADGDHDWRGAYAQGRVFFAKGQFEAALSAWELALSRVEAESRLPRLEEAPAFIAPRPAALARTLVELQLKLGRTGDAWVTVDRLLRLQAARGWLHHPDLREPKLAIRYRALRAEANSGPADGRIQATAAARKLLDTWRAAFEARGLTKMTRLSPTALGRRLKADQSVLVEQDVGGQVFSFLLDASGLRSGRGLAPEGWLDGLAPEVVLVGDAGRRAPDLLKKHSVSLAPWAAMLVESSRPSRAPVVAGPQRASVEVAMTPRPTALTGKDVAEVLRAARRAQVLHIAGGCKLAGPGAGFSVGAVRVQPLDILAAGQSPQLVVLSGCRQGSGPSLVNAFLEAGARAVVAPAKSSRFDPDFAASFYGSGGLQRPEAALELVRAQFKGEWPGWQVHRARLR